MDWKYIPSFCPPVGEWDGSSAGWDGLAGSCGLPGMSFMEKTVCQHLALLEKEKWLGHRVAVTEGQSCDVQGKVSGSQESTEHEPRSRGAPQQQR